MKSRTSKSLFGVSLFIFILFLAGTVYAASNVLNVKCVDESGKVLAGTKVLIMPLGKDGKWQDKTADNTGVAKFDKLDDGVYRIVARPEGMAPGLYELVLLRNNSQESVTIKCPAGDPLKKFYFEDPMMNNQARVAMNQAMAAFQSSNFPEAEKNLLASLDSNPSNPDTLYYLGVAYVSQKKWDEAKEVLQKAANITNALVSLVMKDAKGVVQPSPYVAVQNLINNLLPNLPALKLRVEGNDEMANKNFKGAVAKFEESLKLTPDDPDTYYNMALAYGYDKQWEAATKAVEKAVALRPEEQAYLSLKKTLASNATIEKAKEIADQGDAAYKSKDFATALKKYEEALGMLPDPVMQASVWAQIGRANTMMKQSEAAIIAYQKAIDLAPQNPDHKKALSQHFTIVGQQQLTDKQYDEAFSSFAQAGISVYQLGQEWAKKKETDLAIMAFERVLKTDPQNVAAYFELGTLYYFDKKDNAKAKENLSKYLQAGKDEKLLEQSRNIMAVIDRKK